MDAYDLKISKIKGSHYKESHRNLIYRSEILQHISGLRQLSRDKRFRGTNLAVWCSKEADRLENELRSAIKA
jgi:hypothetical protein